jgi:hypothetical protein
MDDKATDDELSQATLVEFRKSIDKIGVGYGTPEWNDEIERVRRALVRNTAKVEKRGSLKRIAVINVVADLLRQGWSYGVGEELARTNEGIPKEMRRAQLLTQRGEQLRSPAAQAFVRRMEKSRWFSGKRVSIFSLMRDGRELATSLEKVATGQQSADKAVNPYLQFIEADQECEYTGLPLNEIWRYFRYTWTNPYQSVPGRSMNFLVRDAATPFHSVMGIGCLSSAAVKLRGRDDFIGWEAEGVLKDLDSLPPAQTAAWLESLIESRLGEIYKIDFIEEEILTAAKLEYPTDELIAQLRNEAETRRQQHHRISDPEDHKKDNEGTRFAAEDWIEQALSPLFRSKRAAELANLLWARRVLRTFIGGGADKESISKLKADSEGKKAISDLIRLAKAIRVGTSIADLTVCGAIPPYNPLLVGKLVAMLAISPETILANRSRYRPMASIIASSMAGRPIFRPADLVFIGTTSLYGELPCQYSNISIPAEIAGGTKGVSLKYKYIDSTVGWGTYQFSQETTRSISDYMRSNKNGQRVNYLFGEGANPKMRALREGLAALGFDEEVLLKHGQQKTVFGVALVSNLRDYLLGRDLRPNYLFSLRAPTRSSRNIVSWWTTRWLLKRLTKPGVLDEVQKHTLIHPIEHGARVCLPIENVEQANLLL